MSFRQVLAALVLSVSCLLQSRARAAPPPKPAPCSLSLAGGLDGLYRAAAEQELHLRYAGRCESAPGAGTKVRLNAEPDLSVDGSVEQVAGDEIVVRLGSVSAELPLRELDWKVQIAGAEWATLRLRTYPGIAVERDAEGHPRLSVKYRSLSLDDRHSTAAVSGIAVVTPGDPIDLTKNNANFHPVENGVTLSINDSTTPGLMAVARQIAREQEAFLENYQSASRAEQEGAQCLFGQQACSYPSRGFSMRISIANISKRITAEEFKVAVHAIERQVHEDFAPLWGMDASIRMIRVDRNSKPEPDAALSDAIIYVGEMDDDVGAPDDAVGYHDSNLEGVPYGFVFQDIAKQTGESWTVTLSHEVLELIADPEVNLYVLSPHPRKKRKLALRPYEVCDPVQGDTYVIDSVRVSNFVTPLYFAELPHPKLKQTNYLKLPLKRFGVRPGGYYSFMDLDTHRYSDIYGNKTTGPRIAQIKRALSSARRQYRRMTSLERPGQAAKKPMPRKLHQMGEAVASVLRRASPANSKARARRA